MLNDNSTYYTAQEQLLSSSEHANEYVLPPSSSDMYYDSKREELPHHNSINYDKDVHLYSEYNLLGLHHSEPLLKHHDETANAWYGPWIEMMDWNGNKTQPWSAHNISNMKIFTGQKHAQSLIKKGHLSGSDDVELCSRKRPAYFRDTHVSGTATAILGDVHGDVHIQNTKFVANEPNCGPTNSAHFRIERHNLVQPDYTIETTIIYHNQHSNRSRGSSTTIQKRWKRQEELGAGVFGVVYREECNDETPSQQRAVKILRLAQLRRFKIDYQKEIGALMRLSQVCLISFI